MENEKQNIYKMRWQWIFGQQKCHMNIGWHSFKKWYKKIYDENVIKISWLKMLDSKKSNFYTNYIST